MKKIIKGILWTIGTIISLLLIALVCLIIFIDPILKGVIEGFGPEIAGVRFELESISTSIFKGRIAIKNLIMYNPDGYSSEYAAKLGDVAFETDIKSWLSGQKAIIREVRLRDVTINYETEFPLSEKSNLSDILAHIKGVANPPAEAAAPAAPAEKAPEPATTVEKESKDVEVKPEVQIEPAKPAVQATPAPAAPAPAEKTPEYEGRTFQLDKLIVENVRVVVIPKGMPQFQVPLTLTLPQMGPVGADAKGLPGAKIAEALAAEIVYGVTRSVLESSAEIYRIVSEQGMKLAEDVDKKVKDYTADTNELTKSIKEDNVGEAIRQGGELLQKVSEDKDIQDIGKGIMNFFKAK